MPLYGYSTLGSVRRPTPLRAGRGIVLIETRQSVVMDLLAGVPAAEWGQLYLLRKIISSRQVAITVHEHTSDHEHRIVRRGYLRQAAWHLSFPT